MQLNGARDSGVLVLQGLDLKGVPEALTAASGGLQELCELGTSPVPRVTAPMCVSGRLDLLCLLGA